MRKFDQKVIEALTSQGREILSGTHFRLKNQPNHFDYYMFALEDGVLIAARKQKWFWYYEQAFFPYSTITNCDGYRDPLGIIHLGELSMSFDFQAELSARGLPEVGSLDPSWLNAQGFMSKQEVKEHQDSILQSYIDQGNIFLPEAKVLCADDLYATWRVVNSSRYGGGKAMGTSEHPAFDIINIIRSKIELKPIKDWKAEGYLRRMTIIANQAETEMESALSFASALEGVEDQQEKEGEDMNSVLEQLKKLGELRDAGVLTDSEFDSKKQKLLGKI